MSDLTDRTFWIANDREIKGGLTTDYYFLNVEKALRNEGRDPRVVMEVYTRHLPYQENWGILGGINEALKLLYGKPVDVWTMDEGEVFISSKNNLAYEPVMRIEGGYADFARYETPILGFLCSLSGITTKAARLRSLAGANKRLLSFGTRRAHPALSAAIERCAYIGGFDG
ncbi:MAG: nicotinate phosphoribosyltransferase, partial [Nitrososphaerota archaeon]|nr:nicotinate phosphoribosyltransferase [Nitrososphaerota archaeon]